MRDDPGGDVVIAEASYLGAEQRSLVIAVVVDAPVVYCTSKVCQMGKEGIVFIGYGLCCGGLRPAEPERLEQMRRLSSAAA